MFFLPQDLNPKTFSIGGYFDNSSVALAASVAFSSRESKATWCWLFCFAGWVGYCNISLHMHHHGRASTYYPLEEIV